MGRAFCELEHALERCLHTQPCRPLTRECLWAMSRFSGAQRQSRTQLLISLTDLLRHTHSVTDPPRRRRRARLPASPHQHWQVNGLDKSYIMPSSSDQSPRGFCYSVCVCQGHFFTEFSATDIGAIVPGRKVIIHQGVSEETRYIWRWASSEILHLFKLQLGKNAHEGKKS